MLDTNVVSELLRKAPDIQVVAWVDAQDTAGMMLTVVTVAELRAGVALLPRGRRRAALGERIESVLADAFADQALAFDIEATTYYAEIVAARRRSGRPIHALDAQIAAICRRHAATLATRNTDDFTGTGVDLVSPWSN